MNPSDDFAARLRKLTPDGSSLDVAELAFRAGQRSVRPRRLWPTLSAVLASTQVLMLGFWLTSSPESAPGPQLRDRPVVEAPTEPTVVTSPYSYAALRDVASGRAAWPDTSQSTEARPDRPILTVRIDPSEFNFD